MTGTEDPELFGTERFGHFSYSIPVDKRGRYTVILHFVESYYGPQLRGGGAGTRIFHVFCNGQTLLQDFDIFKEAGSMKVSPKLSPTSGPPRREDQSQFRTRREQCDGVRIEVLDASPD